MSLRICLFASAQYHNRFNRFFVFLLCIAAVPFISFQGLLIRYFLSLSAGGQVCARVQHFEQNH